MEEGIEWQVELRINNQKTWRRKYDQWSFNLAPPPESRKEDKAHGNARPMHPRVKCFECGEYGHKSYKCLKRKNQTKGVVNHLEPRKLWEM
jgi:hypothetical protein